MDDMLIKRKVVQIHIDDLRKTFTTLRKSQMKLNPFKCAFGVALDKILDCIIFNRGWKLMGKIEAICDMSPLRMIKDV